ncbi:type VI secretion protein IcmF/TssM N-terminal domain-containing protein [Chitinibacter sp. S2-10]|uniref:type VI secretion protein IcmF/TssM N-terminal domain-containing protein n=1 Tax=Chitinibacter sp. S2-10 TaxID=3373597 RepID=UPI003977D5FB
MMKVFGLLVGLLILALGCWGVALWNEWPVWAALFLFFGVLGLYFLVRWIIRLVKGSLARSQMATPVEKPEPVQSAESALKAKWKEAISLLRNSNLRRLGNPLYVLPWYMVIGRSGSGKTTALTRARLSSPLKKRSFTGKVESTLNVDWWYFDKAIVLDTAGRYIEPEEIEADRQEWEKMLDLLGRYRAKEGLNGLVLTIQADHLLNPDADVLANEGRVIRMRIEQMIRLFDKRFPIYVLVTKCDQLYGLEAWSQLLPEGVLDQAMGYVGLESMQEQLDEAGFVDAAFSHVSTQLKRLQLAMMQRLESADPRLLLLPSELLKLQEPLKVFLRHALGDSPYLEDPFLRGVFFSSGVQQGGAVSSLLKEIAPQEPEHAPVYKGLFLHDLFDRVLPGDRYLLHPAALISHWRRATRHLGAMAWLLLCLAAGCYLSFSFVHSLNTLNQMRDMYPGQLSLTGQLRHDIESLDQFRSFVYWLERRDAQVATRYLAFDGRVAEVETQIKANYVAKFRKYILPGLDDAFSNKIESLASAGQSELLADYIQTLVRRINLVQARLENASHEELRKMPPLSGAVLFEMDPGISPEAASHFNEMYVALLAWQPNDLFRLQRLAVLRNDLNQIALSSNDFHWIIDWSDAQPDLKKVRLADYWQGTRQASGLPEISAAFTVDGKARIDAFMAEVRKSAPNQARFDEKLQQFNQWYLTEKIRVWRDFAWNFPQGEDLLRGENEWRSVMVRLTAQNSPYTQLANRLVSEFKGVAPEQMPGWLALNQQLFSIRQRANQQGMIKTPGTINDIGGKLLKQFADGGNIVQAKTELEMQFKAIGVYQGYESALGKVVADSTLSMAKAAQTSADFHGFDANPNTKSALQDAYSRLSELRSVIRTQDAEDQVAWGLLAGPLQLAVRFADRQASCVLQKDWDSKVIWPMQSATALPEMLDQLYGEKGSVWGFLNGSAKPFVSRGQDAYLAVETLGQSVPFTAEFMPFINGAIAHQVSQKVAQQQQLTEAQRAELILQQQKQTLAEQSKQAEAKLNELQSTAASLKEQVYPVKITGLPTGLNEGAKANVLATVLSVQCANSPFTLNNLNFSVTDSLNWSQQSCGDATLKIRFPSFSVSKKYPDPQGFLAFLQDFQAGTHTFDATDFPRDKMRLDALNIKQIQVRYQFAGEDAALKNMRQLALIAEENSKALQEKQEAKAMLTNIEQQAFQSKMNGATPGPVPMKVQVPSRIGLCWNEGGKVKASDRPVRQVIDELVAKTMSDAASQAASSVPSKAAISEKQSGSQRLKIAVGDNTPQLKKAVNRAEQWLAKEGRFTLQIWLADSPAAAENMLRRLSSESEGFLLAYPTIAGGRQIIAIASGDVPSAKEAQAAKTGLADSLKAQGPMIRSSQGIRAELSKQKFLLVD